LKLIKESSKEKDLKIADKTPAKTLCVLAGLYL